MKTIFDGVCRYRNNTLWIYSSFIFPFFSISFFISLSLSIPFSTLFFFFFLTFYCSIFSLNSHPFPSFGLFYQYCHSHILFLFLYFLINFCALFSFFTILHFIAAIIEHYIKCIIDYVFFFKRSALVLIFFFYFALR